MGNEGFFRRWSRLKSHGDDAPADAAPAAHDARPATAGQPYPAAADSQQTINLPPLAQTAPHPPVAPPPPDRAPRKPPTLEDIAALGPDADFSAFVSQGVDKNVQRLAMKKLFSDPHFSVLDGLDVYIDDYTRADPIPAAVLASLDHAKSVFARILDNDTPKKGEGDAGPAAGASPDAPPPPDHNNDA